MEDSTEARLSALGITLPPLPKPMANYVPYKLSGNLLYLSGQGPRFGNDGDSETGRVGGQVTAEEAYQHARLAGIRLLAVAKAALGSLDRVRQVVKVLGFVNAEPTFRSHPAVINGCSDLFVDVFGDRGRHARSAVGAGSLPGDITVEIEAIFEVDPTEVDL